MFHLSSKYDCLFSSTEILFSMLSEYEFHFSKKKNNFLIPQTVIYKKGVPISYTLMDGTTIVKKSNYKDITIEKIIKNCKDDKKFFVNSYFLSEIDRKLIQNKTEIKKYQFIEIEFCNEENMRYFLVHKKNATSGLFQKFVNPLDDKNCIIEAEFNNQSLKILKYTNLHTLNDNYVENYIKLFTNESEGEKHIVISNCPNKRLAKTINEIFIEIKRRLNQIYNHKYSTIVKADKSDANKVQQEFNILNEIKLAFKIDEKFQVYLLYCTEIKFNLEKNIQIPSPQEKLREFFFVKFNFSSEMKSGTYSIEKVKKMIAENQIPPINLDEYGVCLNCDHYKKSNMLSSISFSLIIENQKLSHNTEIPKVIKKTILKEIEEDDETKMNKILQEVFLKKVKNNEFKETKVLMCGECYLINTNHIIKKPLFKKIQIKNKKPLYIDYKSIENPQIYLSKKENNQFKKFEMLLGSKSPEIFKFHPKQSELIPQEMGLDVRNFTRLKLNSDIKKMVNFNHKSSVQFISDSIKNPLNKRTDSVFMKIEDETKIETQLNTDRGRRTVGFDFSDVYFENKYFGSTSKLVKYFSNKKEIKKALKEILLPKAKSNQDLINQRKSLRSPRKSRTVLFNEFNLKEDKLMTDFRRDSKFQSRNNIFKKIGVFNPNENEPKSAISIESKNMGLVNESNDDPSMKSDDDNESTVKKKVSNFTQNNWNNTDFILNDASHVMLSSQRSSQHFFESKTNFYQKKQLFSEKAISFMKNKCPSTLFLTKNNGNIKKAKNNPSNSKSKLNPIRQNVNNEIKPFIDFIHQLKNSVGNSLVKKNNQEKKS